MSDIQNIYRSQRSNLITLILSSILLSLLINLISNIFSQYISYDFNISIIITILTVVLLIILLFFGFDIPLTIYRTIKIPLIFKIENEKLKIIAIEGYRILKDLEYKLSQYFEEFKDSEKHIASLFTKYSSWDDDELSHFINDLMQYIVWDIFLYFHHSNQKVLRKENLYHIDYDAYPDELKDNFLLSFHHDEREKWAEIHRKRGDKVSEDYYKLKFIS